MSDQPSSVPPWMMTGTATQANRGPQLVPQHVLEHQARNFEDQTSAMALELLWRRKQAREHANYWDGFDEFVAELRR